MNRKFEVVEKFEITGRGVVVVIDEVTENVPGQSYQVQITSVDGRMLTTEAFKDLMLRTSPEPIEKEGYNLKGLHKEDISDNATLVFI